MGTSAKRVSDGRSKKRPGVDEQRETILQAAVELFAEQGVRGVSIARICDQADVSRPTFYRCFEDKAALVAKIYDRAVNSHVTGVLVRGNLGEPENLRQRLDDMLEGIFSNAQLARLVFAESGDSDSPAAPIVNNAFERAADVLTRDLADAGRIPPGRVYLKSIMAAIQWIVHDAIRQGLDDRTRHEARDATYALVLRALSD